MTLENRTAAILVLGDGTQFAGYSIGAEGISVGEVVFNTSITGYQEILTDPSYAAQIITLTYPHIGNVGVNSEDEESDRIWCAGLIVRNLSLATSSFRSENALDKYLKSRNILGIAGIDTRKLTRILREKGAQNGCLMAGVVDRKTALEKAKEFPGLKGMDLARRVSRKDSLAWHQGVWTLGAGYKDRADASRFQVVAYDYGVKRTILRMLSERGCRVTLVPAETPADEVLALQPDGVFLSNGPGDPEPCDYAIAAIRKILETDIPVFGICLGHQLLALASGARTLKMKFGHQGANHPVRDMATGVVMITSQNHGFAVDESSLPGCLKMTHKSLFDDSLQGIHRTDKAAFGFQGHPEASPGPQDAAPLFDYFTELMENHRSG